MKEPQALERVERVEQLIRALESEPHARATELARELLRELLSVHRHALERLLAAVPGDAARAEPERDPLLKWVLALHELGALPAREALIPAERLLRDRASQQSDRCELCGGALPTDHAHLFDREGDKLVCACAACERLFEHEHAGRFRTGDTAGKALGDLGVDRVQWQALGLPIDLVFFRQRWNGKVVASYPSPGGVVVSPINVDAFWAGLQRRHASLRDLRDEIECVLADGTREPLSFYRVSLAECYRLVGLVRKHWRGLGGGTELRDRTKSYFDDLTRRLRQPASGGATCSP